MKHLFLFLLLWNITYSSFSQSLWNIKTTSSGLTSNVCKIRAVNDRYFAYSTEVFLTAGYEGTLTGIVFRPGPLTANNIFTDVLEGQMPNGSPFFIVAQRSIQGSTGYTLSEYRPGTGYVNPQIFPDTLGSLNNGARPNLIQLDQQTIYAFGRQFFRKISFSHESGFTELWSKPLSSPMTDVILHNNQFVLTDEAGNVQTLDLEGNIIWTVNYPYNFRSITPVEGGFAACVRATTGISLVKLSSTGQEEWSANTENIGFYQAAGSAGGGIVVVGTSTAGRMILAQFNNLGNLLWQKDLGAGVAASIVNGIDGGLVILGRESSFLRLIKTDENGNTVSPQIVSFASRILKSPAIQAFVSPDANMFLNTLNQISGFTLDSVATIFSCAPWIGGTKDDVLYLAGEKGYDSNGDYRPGWTTIDKADFNRTWLVTKADIQRLRRDFGEDHVLDEKLAFDILTWPGKGNPHLLTKADFSPINTDPNLFPAPFIDNNGDGIYNVYDGDYPQIKGDQAAFWIITDSVSHTESSMPALPLKADLSFMAYTFDCAQSDLVSHSVFVDVDIINRSNDAYENTYVGFITDFDIGCPTGDYVGTLVPDNTIYAYNSTADDATCDDNIGWGTQIPVQSMTLLNQSLNHSMYLAGSTTTLQDNVPDIPSQYYNYMKSLWRDGTPLTSGGTGINTGSTNVVNHVFPDDPSDVQGWSMCTSNATYGDIRGLASHGPFLFAPQDTFSVTLQFTTHRDIPHPCPSITTIVQPRIEQLQQWFNNGALYASADLGQVAFLPEGQAITLDAEISGASYLWSTGAVTPSITVDAPGTFTVHITLPTGCEQEEQVKVQLATAVAQPAELPSWQIQPNPASTSFLVNCSDCDMENAQIILRNAQGQEVLHTTGYNRSIPLINIPGGFHWVELWQEGRYLGSKKLIIQPR